MVPPLLWLVALLWNAEPSPQTPGAPLPAVATVGMASLTTAAGYAAFLLGGLLTLATPVAGWRSWLRSKDTLLGRLALVSVLQVPVSLLILLFTAGSVVDFGLGVLTGYTIPTSQGSYGLVQVLLAATFLIQALGFPVAAALVLRGARQQTD
ncbi:MAG: hypothetical protein M0031_00720 [Thermaerobacter sp.]|nr:hypothetical protein [Thermaerobacter sp.]